MTETNRMLLENTLENYETNSTDFLQYYLNSYKRGPYRSNNLTGICQKTAAVQFDELAPWYRVMMVQSRSLNLVFSSDDYLIQVRNKHSKVWKDSFK